MQNLVRVTFTYLPALEFALPTKIKSGTFSDSLSPQKCKAKGYAI